ncbi:hypothetical protein KIL84_005372 [Mauremys mutica]|uniref:Uncharacterized protein n=1 Tax=Mauremys mutica TaxID=74926 RepID=A0A9D3XKT9_9SAUR|nr:hypothetical protein KIL84_005372 [Mauremys mutica]
MEDLLKGGLDSQAGDERLSKERNPVGSLWRQSEPEEKGLDCGKGLIFHVAPFDFTLAISPNNALASGILGSWVME